ncbi:MAG: ABC transporter substrate-binding protein [Nitriliruptorales bacterium]|nr:ABC transporter substrate-binding protein [Nitriliruptorales bacterium]
MPGADARARGPLRVHALAAATLLLALVMTACAAEPTPAPGDAAPAGAATDEPDGSGEGAREHIQVGVTGTASDSQLYIAEAEGFFNDQGIDVEFVAFDSGAQMIAPLGGGDLQVAAGAPSAGLYNAVSRGIGMRIVADKARVNPDEPAFLTFVVRKDLADSGEFSGPADLAGATFAHPAQGASTEPSLNALLEEHGVDYGDVDHTYIGFAEHIAAFENGAIDASLLLEPFLTRALNAGLVEEFVGLEEIYPNQQNAVLMYSEAFAEETDVAERFMVAYLQGIDFYNSGVEDGRFGGENGDRIVDILLEYTSIDEETLREIRPPGMSGEVNLESLRADFDFFESQGMLEGEVDLDSVMDTSFVEAARTGG